MKAKYILFVLLFSFAYLVFIAHIKVVGNGVWGDGQYYYAYLRSAVIDGNLYMQDELTYFNRQIILTINGFAANKYSIGPAILWFPFFIIAHMTVLILNRGGVSAYADGYNSYYQIAVGLGSVWYSMVGLWLCFQTASRYFGKKNALLSTLTIWLSTNLFFYTSIDPINSHALSFFLASSAIWTACKKFKNKSIKYILLGVVAGLLVINRNQDIVVILPLLLLHLPKVRNVLLFSVTFLIVCAPQFAVWYLLYGKIANPYLASGEKFYFAAPFIKEVLWGSSYGLFYYAPSLLPAAAGLLLQLPKNKLLPVAGLIAFGLQIYIISSWHDWHGGASYGARMFISLMPYFIFGFAAFIHQMRLKKIILPIVIPIFILVNVLYILNFLYIQP